ncbi:hypothetical protein I6N91_16905 [Arthrobacter sp. MSA 4-2]|uniref:hypothetical protein n=1 Tax=Arthrobacter sp. MSA 4-2 TaxID=2794349 RepID=UPI0018E86770|nr:hypothetical protein [Arthrobacter sp. MSA 4-2]MBJ2122655.1 hypothetical protein [Arthrobacter sp. MSA 4-2]
MEESARIICGLATCCFGRDLVVSSDYPEAVDFVSDFHNDLGFSSGQPTPHTPSPHTPVPDD